MFVSNAKINLHSVRKRERPAVRLGVDNHEGGIDRRRRRLFFFGIGYEDDQRQEGHEDNEHGMQSARHGFGSDGGFGTATLVPLKGREYSRGKTESV